MAQRNLREPSPKVGGLNKWLITTALGGGVVLAVVMLGQSEAPPLTPEAAKHETPLASSGEKLGEGLPTDYSHLFKPEPAVVRVTEDGAPLQDAPALIRPPRPPQAPVARCVRPPTTYDPARLHEASVHAQEYRDCLAERAYTIAMGNYAWEHGNGVGTMAQGGGNLYSASLSGPQARNQPSGGSMTPAVAPASAGGSSAAQQANAAAPRDRQQLFQASVAGNSALYHDHMPEEMPVDACIVPAGTLIKALLAHDVNPNMAGTVTAVTSTDVYDFTGTVKAIPAWSKIETAYDYELTYGQESLQVVSTILTTPDGRTMSLGGMTAGNAQGMAGIPVDVNNHNLRLFGTAVLGAVIDAIPAAAGLRANVNVSTGAEEISSTGRLIVERELQRRSSAEPVDAGTEITIKVPQHVVMCPENL